MTEPAINPWPEFLDDPDAVDIGPEQAVLLVDLIYALGDFVAARLAGLLYAASRNRRGADSLDSPEVDPRQLNLFADHSLDPF